MSKKIEIENIYALSSMQEGLLFRSLVNPQSGEYVLQSEFDIRGTIDIDGFRRSFQLLVDRHDILRTVFNYKKADRPLQIVLKKRPASVHAEDLRHLEHAERLAHVRAFQDADLARGFDLTKDLLIRCALLQTEDERYKLILTYHHILMDGWCLGIIFNELTQMYRSIRTGSELQLSPAYPYSRYVKWMEDQDKAEAERYWERLLSGYEQPALLPQADKRGEDGVYDFQKLVFEFDPATTRALTLLAKEAQVTLYTVMQTLWGILLQKYNNTPDVVFGAVVSGRPAEVSGVDRIVGLFINTIPVRIRREDDQTFTQLVRQAQQQVADGNPYEYFPLYRVLAKSGSGQQLLQHIIAFENYPLHRELQSGHDDDLGFAVADFAIREQTNFDLNVVFAPGERMTVTMTYNAHVYTEGGIRAIEAHLRQLVRAVLDAPEGKLSELDVTTAAERRIQLAAVHDNRAAYPEQMTLPALFEQQASRAPDQIAVTCGESSLTYRELHIRSNRLAHVLRSKGVVPDQPVALLLQRSPDMIVAILAVLKAGGAYVPIDPAYPQDRIRFMLADCGAQLLIASERTAGTGFAGSVLAMDDPQIAGAPDADLPPTAAPHHLAYMIYTSGTTGTPKGVMIEHRNVVRLFFHEGCLFNFGPDDVWTLFHSYCFDFSVWEMFGALLHGGRLVIVPDRTARDPQRFLSLLQAERVTVLNQTPTMFYQLVQAEEKQPADVALKVVIFGGEALAPYQLRNWKQRHPHVRLINMYGITETTVHVTYNELSDEDIAHNISNIGRPIPTLGLYVLDRHLNLLPQGATGEIYVTGEGVARGYRNRPELTAERFLPNPYAPGELLYKTGDLGKWRHDWNLEYLGRADHQVKIRGYRIELGEIEFALLQHPDIQEAVVLAKPAAAGTSVLCAYFKASRPLALEDIRAYAEQQLPSYMAPSLFYQLEEIPLTVNGKIDRQALFAQTNVMGTAAGQAADLADELERELFAIWKEVLGSDHFGLNDHFFDVGGNSILLLQVHNRIESRYPGKMNVADLFAASTLSKMKEHIRRHDPNEGPSFEIEGLTLPAAFYVRGAAAEAETSQYRYALTGELHEQLAGISRQQQHALPDLLQGLFAYVLSELLQKDRIPLHVLTPSGAVQVIVESSRISGFPELFRLVAAGTSEENGMYRLSHLNKARQMAGPDTVYPVFAVTAEEGGAFKLTDYFDLGLEWRPHQAGGDLWFHFDARRLAKEQLRTVYSQYIGFLKLFADNHHAAIGQ